MGGEGEGTGGRGGRGDGWEVRGRGRVGGEWEQQGDVRMYNPKRQYK